MAVAEYGERSNKRTKDTEKAMRDLAEKVGFNFICIQVHNHLSELLWTWSGSVFRIFRISE